MGIGPKSSLFARFADDRSRARDAHVLRIAHPIRRGDDHFVARIEERERQIEERMFRAHRDAHFVGRMSRRTRTRRDGLAQRQNPFDRRVFRRALLHCAARGLKHVRGRLEIRLAHPEIENVGAACSELLRARVHCERCARLDRLQTRCESPHLVRFITSNISER